MTSSLPGFSRVHTVVFGTTFLCILLGLLAGDWLSSYEPVLVLGLMLLLGLPHGATDRGLYLSLRDRLKSKRLPNFYATYAGLIGLFGLVWLLLPAAAFGFFLLLSIYHFGQSNWVKTRYRRKATARLHYLLWGAGVLLTPILLHTDEALAITSSMVRWPLDASVQVPARWVAVILAALNVGFIVYLRWRRVLSGDRAGRELLAYGLLVALFLTNSLLLGFTIYFVVWHSLASALDQWRFFRAQANRDRLFRPLFRDIVVVVLSAALFCVGVWWYAASGAALSPALMGYVFITISLLTLPHMLLVELLYHFWKPTSPPKPHQDSLNSRGRRPSASRAVSLH